MKQYKNLFKIAGIVVIVILGFIVIINCFGTKQNHKYPTYLSRVTLIKQINDGHIKALTLNHKIRGNEYEFRGKYKKNYSGKSFNSTSMPFNRNSVIHDAKIHHLSVNKITDKNN